MKYSKSYESVSFSGTIFEESTKKSEESNVISTLTIGNDTLFKSCVFIAPYQIVIPDGVTATFTNCVAKVKGRDTEVDLPENPATGTTITISIGENGEVTVE